jgi:hypothetical protein
MTPAQLQKFLGTNFPATAQLLGSLPQMVPVFQNVPTGTRPLSAAGQDDADQRGQLPEDRRSARFRLFTWFFVVPGALLVLISAYGLGAFRALHLPTHHHRPHATAA